MIFFKKLYHLLGGLPFAITLIAATALFVICGTFIESATASHGYAAHFIYSNPLFIALLWGFFINILFAAFRRWPFKMRHIPFLITHLGLLMILAGALVKSYYGIQGTMGLMEGSGSSEIFLPESFAIHLEKKNPANFSERIVKSYALKRTLSGSFGPVVLLDDLFSELQITLAKYIPHTREHLETWFKGDRAYIMGLHSVAVLDWTQADNFEMHQSTEPWALLAARTQDIAALAQQAYVHGLQIKLSHTATQELLFQGSLKEALETPIQWSEGSAKLDLAFNYSPFQGFDHPELIAEIQTKGQTQKEILSVPLQGPGSLLNRNIATPYNGKTPFTLDLVRIPAVVMLQDPFLDLYIFAFDASGRVHVEDFRNGNLHSMVLIDQGFGGYAVQTKIPFGVTREKVEEAHLHALKVQLSKSLQTGVRLAAPLQILYDACTKAQTDFVEGLLKFFTAWNNSSGWLYPESLPLSPFLQNIMQHIDWQKLLPAERNSCYWLHALWSELDGQLKQGNDLYELLEKREWPLMDQLRLLKKSSSRCTPEETRAILDLLAQQLFAMAEHLPEAHLPSHAPAEFSARLLTAYLRSHQIHLNNMTLAEPLEPEMIILDCPLTQKLYHKNPRKKLEDNQPAVILKIRKGSKTEWVALAYDRHGQGIKWPMIGGEYLIRFQPAFIKIPYHIRLRHARQINYAHSNQPYSYESDLIITDVRDGSEIAKTISMNRVHETWDGYRFYLANISPVDEASVKHIQLIINHDPGKYFLTYPGAIILSIGILLLFWFSKKNE